MRMTSRARLVAVILVVAALTALLIFWSPGAPTLDQAASRSVSIALDDNPTTFDPAAMTEVISATVGNAVHAPLVRLDVSGNLVNVLADSVAVGADGMTTTIRMNAGAKFGDGSPVTSADVEYSLRRLQNSSSPLKWVCDRIAGYQRTNEQELVIRFAKPEPDFLRLIANLQASVIKSDSDKHPKLPFDSHVLGGGAFTPITNKLEPSIGYSLTANPGFPKTSNVATLTFSVIPDPQNQLQAFRAGKVDVVRLRGPSIAEACVTAADGSVQPKPELGKAKLIHGPASELLFLVFNWSSTQLADIAPADRSAFIATISAKLQRKPLAEKLYFGMADPAVGVVPPRMLPVLQRAPEPRADFKLRSSKTLTLLSANDPASRQIATFLQTQFDDIGVHFEVQFVELSKLAQSLVERKFDVAVPWFEMPVEGVGPWAMFFEERNPFSAFGEGLPGVRERIQAARGILSESERASAYADVVDYINTHQTAWVPIVSRHTVLLVKERLTGVFVDACGTPVWSTLIVGGDK